MTQDKPIKIIFNPVENPANQYIGIMVGMLRQNGFLVEKLDDFFKSWAHFQSIKLVHLNWFENLDDTSKSSMWKSYLRKLVVLSAIRLGGKKLVWTMHNRLSHEKKSGKLSQKLTGKLIRQADAILIHSKVSEDILRSEYPKLTAQIAHIPHPDFIDVYPHSSKPKKETSTKLQLLFIGAVKPYKNIELLIEAVSKFENKVELLIAGNPVSQAYKKELEELAKNNPSIELRLEFIPDQELPELISDSDLLILPYSIESSLNSGTVILALSYGRTVICPRIGTVDDLKDESDDLLDYTYTTEKEHLFALEGRINEAILLKQANPNSLKEKGERMLQTVKIKNNKEEVGKKLIELYHNLLSSKNTF